MQYGYEQKFIFGAFYRKFVGIDKSAEKGKGNLYIFTPCNLSKYAIEWIRICNNRQSIRIFERMRYHE